MKMVWGGVAAALIALLCVSTRAGEEKEPKPPAVAIKMEFKDAALSTVLEQLSESAGLVIVQDATIEGRITIISKQAMSVDEAITLLNSVLKEKGFIGIRTGKVLKIVRLEEAKKRNIPVFHGKEPEKVPDNDDIVTWVIPIQYVDAVALKKDFAPLMSTYGDLSSNALSNSLILTDTGSNIKRFMQIIVAIDTQTSTTAEIKVFQLKYASATNAARLINEIFRPDTATGQQGGQQNPFARFGFGGPGGGGGGPFGGGGGGGRGGGGGGAGGGGGGGADASEASHRAQKVSASADDRTSVVVVSAAPETMRVIEGIIRDLDSNPNAEQGVMTYRLKNAQAANLEGILNRLFGATGATGSTAGRTSNNANSRTSSSSTQRGNSGGAGTGLGSTRGSGNTSGGSSLGGNSSGSFGSGNTAGGNTGRGGAGGFGQGGGGGGGGGAAGTAGGSAAGDLTGQVFVVADYDTNALMVLTPSKNFERVKYLIDELDKPVRQVIIKVLIAEVTHDKTHDAGTDASVLTNGALKNVMTNFGNSVATTGGIAKLVTGDVTVALHALETEGKLEVLSRPQIICSDNQASNITVGQEVPFIISSRTDTTGNVINTIQYQDIGIILNVTAHINNEGLVIMDVEPEVSGLTGQTVPISAGVDAPVFTKRSASTRVGIQDGQTVVIGGLMEDKKTNTDQGVPVLRKVPGLGFFFGRRQHDKSKTELLIFLTPHVAHEPIALAPMSKADSDALQVVPGAIKPGTYEEHIEGLNRGASPYPPPPPGETVQIPEAPKEQKPNEPKMLERVVPPAPDRRTIPPPPDFRQPEPPRPNVPPNRQPDGRQPDQPEQKNPTQSNAGKADPIAIFCAAD